MNKEKYIVPKVWFLAVFIAAIVGYGISFILNIVSLVFSINDFLRASPNPLDYWEVHAGIAISIIFALIVFISSLLIFIRTKEKDKSGFILVNFVSCFLLAIGISSFLSGIGFIVAFIFSQGVWVFEKNLGISILVFSAFQITMSVGLFVLCKKKPRIRRIVLLVECILFAILNSLNMAFYVRISNYIYMFTCFIAFVFDIVIVFALIKMKVGNGDELEAIPLPEKKTSEEEKLTLLLKYKNLLDNGVITQEEFDAKKKELL